MATSRTKLINICWLLGCLVITSCWTSKEQGKLLRQDLDQLKQQITTETDRAKAEQKKTKKIIEQATALLTRNSADVGAQVDRLQVRLEKSVGQVEALENRLIQREQQLAKLQSDLEKLAANSPQQSLLAIPPDADQLFALAKNKYENSVFEEARRLFRHFCATYTQDPRAGTAQFMIGNSYFAEQKFAPAIVEYKKIVEQRKKSRLHADALFKIGHSFYQLRFCGDARLFLKQLVKKHSRHSTVKRARKILRLIRRNRKNRKFCRS